MSERPMRLIIRLLETGQSRDYRHRNAGIYDGEAPGPPVRIRRGKYGLMGQRSDAFRGDGSGQISAGGGLRYRRIAVETEKHIHYERRLK